MNFSKKLFVNRIWKVHQKISMQRCSTDNHQKLFRKLFKLIITNKSFLFFLFSFLFLDHAAVIDLVTVTIVRAQEVIAVHHQQSAPIVVAHQHQSVQTAAALIAVTRIARAHVQSPTPPVQSHEAKAVIRVHATETIKRFCPHNLKTLFDEFFSIFFSVSLLI